MAAPTEGEGLSLRRTIALGVLTFLLMLPETLPVPVLRALVVDRFSVSEALATLFLVANMIGGLVATPLTLTGKTFFTTYLPKGGSPATACSPSEGGGRLYAVSFQNATAVVNYDTSDDDPSAPGEPSTTADRSVELQSLGIPAEVVSVPPNKILRPDLQIDNINATTRWRTFWHLDEDVDVTPPTTTQTTQTEPTAR